MTARRPKLLVADEEDGIGEVGVADQLFRLRAHLAIANDHELRLGHAFPDLSERADQMPMTLCERQPADGDHDPAPLPEEGTMRRRERLLAGRT